MTRRTLPPGGAARRRLLAAGALAPGVAWMPAAGSATVGTTVGTTVGAAVPVVSSATEAAPAATATRPPDPAATWTQAGRPLPRAAEALALLADAASHGLDPADYGTAALHARHTALQATPQAATPAAPTEAVDAAAARASAAAAFATDLQAALLRHLRHLHQGRIDPARVHQRYPLPARDPWDAAAVLQQALANGRLADAVDAAVPTLPMYGQLRAALARYRAWGDDPAWGQPLPPLPARGPDGRPLRPPRLLPGMAWAGLDALAARLQRLGDLAPGAWPPAAPAPASASVSASASAPLGVPAAGPALDGALLVALQRFQRRHGLAPDGVLGAATRSALEVPPARRAEQIALTLERLRWTPLRLGRRMVVVNVPEFVLRAYDIDASGRLQVQATMRVVVGRTRDSQTPLFSEPMRHIEFSPYWNVPLSIARDELVPQFRRAPQRYTAGGFEFVLAGGRVDTALSPQRLDDVLAGRARLRQRPGPVNALGDIKFVFPNDDAIYLHHTPAVQLFSRERRDFSHGCIRVEDPVALARFALAGTPGWDEARITAAMAAGSSTVQRLAEPLPVVIAYGTALVLQGEVHFFADVYGHDAVLARALQALPR